MYKTVSINTVAPKPAETSVLMIYTGGTLGMVYDKNKQLIPFDFEQILEKMPELHLFDCQLTVIAFEKPLDSANIQPLHWLELAHIIHENYKLYDGFVILHGTDTMAFSASALSFLLENLSKPVVFTGAQLPVGAIRTDARVNLVTALEIASATAENGKFMVPEVCIFFNDTLLRGNRAKKVETSRFDAFQSDNYPFLAKVGVNLEFNTNAILPLPEKELSVQTQLCTDIALLKLFPGIHKSLIHNILHTNHLKGIILETFGSGNAPTDAWFVDLLREAIDKGIFILNVSQCSGGKVVHGKYATSRKLQEIGVLSAADTTTEAALTKMMYVLAKNLSPAETIKLLTTTLRGEMS
ncbi:MAG: asparaginase [Verrucomicrobia bacterium]|nr:asparaginase [Cytophagales bacterium]